MCGICPLSSSTIFYSFFHPRLPSLHCFGHIWFPILIRFNTSPGIFTENSLPSSVVLDGAEVITDSSKDMLSSDVCYVLVQEGGNKKWVTDMVCMCLGQRADRCRKRRRMFPNG